LPAEAGCETC